MVCTGIYMPLDGLESPYSIPNEEKLVGRRENEKMFRKALLLALVCVAATQVRGIDLRGGTEEAINRAHEIFVKFGDTIYYVVGIFGDHHFEFYKICETYWGIVWDYADEELDQLQIASQELTAKAKAQNSPQSVFTCITERTKETDEVLRVMPWTFDRRLHDEAKRFHDDHYKIVEIAYQYMSTYRDEYWDEIVKSLKECDSQKCLDKVLKDYEDECDRRSEILGKVTNQLDAHAEEFRVVAKNMLTTVKDTFTFARVAGVNEIKKCLTAN